MGAVVDEIVRKRCSGMDSAARQIGDSWTLLIVWATLQGATRFDDIQGHLGIARNILSNRLSKLVDDGILAKHPVLTGALRQEYRLTGKGEALRPTLELMEGWGNSTSMNDVNRDVTHDVASTKPNSNSDYVRSQKYTGIR
jgi:DNA-binding HxlR family transcriptional regulator